MQNIFAIVVTYNGQKWIEKCLTSLDHSGKISHTIVIDNGSTDGTVDTIRNKYPNVELIKSKTNLGFGQANNIGITKAMNSGADAIFLLNQDAWLKKNAIEYLVNALRSNPEYGIVSPIHLNGSQDGIDYKFSLYLSSDRTPFFLSDLYKNKLKGIYQSGFVNAAAWMISSKCIKKIGVFNPFFALYGEDEDFVNRLHYYNFKLGVVPKSVIIHDRLQLKMNDYQKRNIDSIIVIKDLSNLGNPLPSYNYLARRVLANVLYYLIAYNKKNVSCTTQIKRDLLAMRYLGKIKRYRSNLNSADNSISYD